MAAAGAAAAAAAGAATGAVEGSGTHLPAALSTSSLVTRLKLPVPLMALMSRLFSSASFLAEGVALMVPGAGTQEEDAGEDETAPFAAFARSRLVMRPSTREEETVARSMPCSEARRRAYPDTPTR